jgi:NAD(P)-dependent dehydrogenase (short-subunit alcohol dehydrogenase family)
MTLSYPTFYDRIQALRGLNPTSINAKQIPSTDLKGKWIVISGSNSGIGLEAAKSFASWGANLILACRHPLPWELNPAAVVKECKDIAEASHHLSKVEWWEIDMADLDSVEAFCQRWLETGRALDILCNNAGLGSTDKTKMTKDGFQIVHQVRIPTCTKR